MRFRRWPRPTSCEDTPRKRAAYLRKQHRECESLPLFASIVQSQQHDVEAEMARRAEHRELDERNARATRAGRWRDVREVLFALDPARRRIVRQLWRDCPYPADPSYLDDLLHQIAIGKIEPSGRRGSIEERRTRGSHRTRRRSKKPSARLGSARLAAPIRPTRPMSSPGAAISAPAS